MAPEPNTASLLPSLGVGFSVLTASHYSLTYEGSRTACVFRLLIAPVGLYAFYDFCWRSYVEHDGALWPSSYSTIWTLTAIGVARIVDVCVLSLLDIRPPHYVEHTSGNNIPLPTTSIERLIYALDLTSSLDGTSYRSYRHWNWTSSKLAAYHAPRSLTSSRFVLNSIVSALLTYLPLDLIRSYIHAAISPTLKARSYDNYTPVTMLLPFWQQIVLALEFFMHAQAVFLILHTSLLVICVGSGLSSDLDNWPPPFDNPWWSHSLPHFWSQAWHSMHRRLFLRFAFPFVYFLFPSTRHPTVQQKARRPKFLQNGTSIAQHDGNELHEVGITQDGDDATRWDKKTPKIRLSPSAAYVTMILSFIASGIFHLGLVFRVRLATPPGTMPRPQASLLRFWKYDLSAANFFFAQPIGITFDMMLLRPIFGASSMIRRVFAWVWLLYTVRWWLDAWAAAGMLDGDEPWLLGSPVTALIGFLGVDPLNTYTWQW